MVKIGITLHDVQHFFGGDPLSLVRVAQAAEEHGVDHIILGDHLILTARGAQTYPSGTAVPYDYEQYEPLITLSAIASATSRIRLSTGILIGPLRPAILLAKQVASLDMLSGGRFDLGIGAGWQQDELEAAGIPFEGRFGRLEEQVRACKEIWANAPATYHGKTVSFTEAYSKPFPAQGGNVPIWFGFSLSDRNIKRIAELASGWIATSSREHSADFRDNVAKLRSAFVTEGRDPSTLEVCLTPSPIPTSGGGFDFEATLAGAEQQVADGATILVYRPNVFCRAAEDIVPFLTRLRQLKRSLNSDLDNAA